MTPERLEEIVVGGDSKALVNETAGLAESQRRKLSKTAQTLKREFDNSQWESVGGRYVRILPERLQAIDVNKEVEYWQQARTCHLAVLAVCPLSQAKKATSIAGRGEDEDFVLQIMSDRRPEWIDDWVIAALNEDFSTISWETLQSLIRSGVCSKPTTDGYYRAMAVTCTAAHWRLNSNEMVLSEYLEKHPDLLDDIWKLFEVETVAFSYDWGESHDKKHESWPKAIYNLVQRGVIDRARLLEATLAGQTTGFKKNLLSGFARLHEQLKPTADELEKHQTTYFDLIASPVPQVVGFAIKMIKKVEQAKRLEDSQFIAASGSVFDVATKGPPKTVVSLLKKIAKRNPDQRQPICSVLLDAMRHPAEDVQMAAVDLLIELATDQDTDIVSQIAECVPDLPASIRSRVTEFVANTGETVVDPHCQEDLAQQVEDSKTSAQQLDPKWTHLAGVDEAIAAIEDSSWPPPLQYELMQIPIFADRQQVEPIESLDELIDAVAHAIEKVDSAIEIERIIDGISRLCDQTPDDFSSRVAPLVQRIEKTKDTETPKGISKRHIAPEELVNLLGVWLAENPKIGSPSWVRQNQSYGVVRFIESRLAAIRDRVKSRIACPLLATPTHEHGWVHPQEIVARWQTLQERKIEPAEPEVILALLRMGPDGRSEALPAAKSLTHRWAKALRWALGSDEKPTRRDRRDADVYLAAGRAKKPYGMLEELKVLKLGPAPDAIEPASYCVKTSCRDIKYGNDEKVVWMPQLSISTTPSIRNSDFDKSGGRPTVLRHASETGRRVFIEKSAWVNEWVAMIWPANVDAYYAAGCRALVLRIDEKSSNWDPNFAYLHPLFDVDRPWSSMAYLLAVLGIAGRDQDVRGLAIDAFVEAIADGRVHPKPLGQTLETLSETHWLKLNRLSENLSEIARISAHHAWVIISASETLLSTYHELPRDVHHLLSMMKELYAELGMSVSNEVANQLGRVKGASKTAKLAKSILSNASPEPTAAANEARLLALESRLNRAQRWAESI